MKKYIFSVFTVITLFLLTACGGGGSSSDITNDPIAAASKQSAELTNPEVIITDALGKDFTVRLHILKNENGNYNITLNNFNLEVNGCSILPGTLVFNPSTLLLDGNAGSQKDIDVHGTFSTACSEKIVYTLTADQTIEISGNIEQSSFISSSVNDSSSGGGTLPAATGYTFFNADTPLVISQSNTVYELKAQLLKDGFIASGEIVNLEPFNAQYGNVLAYTTTTGSDGYAKFVYTSPQVLPANGTTASVRMVFITATNQIYTQDIVLDFNTSGSAATSQFSLVNETTPIEITAANQVQNISVTVIDTTNNVGVAGKEVSISTLPAGYGAVTASTVVTDASGKAEFAYQAPSDLTAINLTSTNATLSFTENGITISKVITFDFNETTVTSEYNLTNANDIAISYAGESKEIAVQLVKNGVPQVGENVVAKSIAAAYGIISNANVVTGTDGYARFTYVAATPLTDANTTLELVYTDVNGAAVTTTVDINISAQAQVVDYNLTNVTTPVIVNYNDELKTISVDVVDQNGIGIAGQSVSISVVQGVEFGSIIGGSTINSDASGHAIFTYKAPADVASVDGNTSILTLSLISNGITITENVILNFQKVDLNVSVPVVIIANTYKEINLTSNGQSAEIQVQVFEKATNVPYTQGNVKVSLPQNVLDGVDVGHFTTYTVAVNSSGIATFNYVGPLDLQTLVNSGESNATFSFFHEDNPTNKESVTVIYDLTDNYIPANYLLTTTSSDGNQTMGLQLLKTFTLYLKDDQGTLIDDADITQITITSKNTLIGKLVDASNAGSLETTLTLVGAGAVNSRSFPIQTFTLSGLLPIEITVDFTDGNGNPDSITTIMNVVVFSGPPTALSISYAGVEQNTTLAKYTEKFVLTVTDAYNNPVNTRPYVAVGAMVEYAVDGSSQTGTRTQTSPRLWHGLSDSYGDINTIGGNKAQFETVSNIFTWVDFNNDKLVLFGAGFVYEALGKWDILDSGSANILDLQDDYNGSDRTGLYYAVGHNNRQDLCSNDGRQYVGNMKATNYQLDETGHALIDFEYDYHLTGKDIMVWVNLTGFQADNNTTGRIGEAQKHTLRGAGFASPEEYTVPFGATNVSLHFTVYHKNAPETYRNGHFGFATSGTCSLDGILDWSNMHDARDCNNTLGYVDLNVSNPSTGDCTITIIDDSIGVSSEFTGVSF